MAMLFHVIAVLFGAAVIEYILSCFIPWFMVIKVILWRLGQVHYLCRCWPRLVLYVPFAWTCRNGFVCFLKTRILFSWFILYAISIHRVENTNEQHVRVITMVTVFGAWLGAWVIPLDWDRPWQQWPLPCVLGSFFAWSLAQICAPIYFYFKPWRKVKSRKSTLVEKNK